MTISSIRTHITINIQVNYIKNASLLLAHEGKGKLFIFLYKNLLKIPFVIISSKLSLINTVINMTKTKMKKIKFTRLDKKTTCNISM